LRLSGIVLATVTTQPLMRFFPLWAVELVTTIHHYEAWLATLAILIWHFYWVIFNPDVYPVNWSWLTSMISEEMLRHDHPSEYERLRAEGQVASAPGGPPLPDAPDGSASPAEP
jgi:hypothetical protein